MPYQPEELHVHAPEFKSPEQPVWPAGHELMLYAQIMHYAAASTGPQEELHTSKGRMWLHGGTCAGS